MRGIAVHYHYIEWMKLNRKKIASGTGIIAIMALAYAVPWRTGILATIVNGDLPSLS